MYVCLIEVTTNKTLFGMAKRCHDFRTWFVFCKTWYWSILSRSWWLIFLWPSLFSCQFFHNSPFWRAQKLGPSPVFYLHSPLLIFDKSPKSIGFIIKYVNGVFAFSPGQIYLYYGHPLNIFLSANDLKIKNQVYINRHWTTSSVSRDQGFPLLFVYSLLSVRAQRLVVSGMPTCLGLLAKVFIWLVINFRKWVWGVL